jgi:hypothetical protein
LRRFLINRVARCGNAIFVGLCAQNGTTPRLDTMPLVGRMLLVARGFLHSGRLSLQGLLPGKKQRRLHKMLTKDNLTIITEEKDAVAFAVYSKEKDSELAAGNPWKTVNASDLSSTLDDHSTASSFSQHNSLGCFHIPPSRLGNIIPLYFLMAV